MDAGRTPINAGHAPMKTTKQLAVTGALAAAVVATSGCRTIRSSDSYYPTPKNQPAEALPAETAVEPVAVPPATVSVAPLRCRALIGGKRAASGCRAASVVAA